MIQEMVIWPHVMAIGAAANELPPVDLVIKEAVLTFLSRYGRGQEPEATAEPCLKVPRRRRPRGGAGIS